MITLYTRNAAIAKVIKDALQGEPVGEIMHEQPNWMQRPASGDYVITRAALTSRIERFAGSLRAMPVVIPEALPWLVERCVKSVRSNPRVIVALVGSDYMQPRGGKGEA